jgi:hypothetical protein
MTRASLAVFAPVALAVALAVRPGYAGDPPTFADRGAAAVDDDDRTLLLSLQPIALALGIFGAEADFVFASRWAVAVEVAAVRRGGETALAVGVGTPFFPLRGAFHGLYVEPRAIYARPLRERVTRVDWATDALGFGATAGWEWTWDYGLSVRLGTGARYYVGAARSLSSVWPGAIALGTERLELVVDASLGWAF